jgi:hypothetical protein
MNSELVFHHAKFAREREGTSRVEDVCKRKTMAHGPQGRYRRNECIWYWGGEGGRLKSSVINGFKEALQKSY